MTEIVFVVEIAPEAMVWYSSVRSGWRGLSSLGFAPACPRE